MNIKKNLLATALLAAMALLPAQASADTGDATFSYDSGKGNQSMAGTMKKENYNVAIRLEGKGLTGVVIKGVRVPLKGVGNISNVKVWLSSELKTTTDASKKKVNDPDITSQDVTVTGDWIDVDFQTPYTMTGSDVYVGYSFNIDASDDTNKQPVMVTSENAGVEGGLYLFTSRTYRSWMDLSSWGASALQVKLSGVATNAASFGSVGTVYGEVNKSVDVALAIKSHGTAGVSSFDYTYELNGSTGSAHVDLGDNAVPAVINASSDLTMTLPSLSAKGSYPWKLTVTKVNGVDNADSAPTVETTLVVFNKKPVHRSVMEEYTGTWCGWCPRGFVGLEVMNRLHPGDFIGISYHNSDPMDITNDYPSYISGFPSAYLDRSLSVDAYYGSSNSIEMYIEEDWKADCAELAIAAVDVTATLNDDYSKVNASAEVTFISDASAANYKVETVLLVDDLHGEDESWLQTNNYSGYGAGYFSVPEFDKFTTAGSSVEGLHFDDVIVASTRLTGEDVALPTSIEADKAYSANAEFTLANVVSRTSGDAVIQDLSQLRVVALLIDASTGKIVNANKCKVGGAPTGISVANADANVGRNVVYDVSGRRVNGLVKGLNIIRKADGSTVKMIGR